LACGRILRATLTVRKRGGPPVAMGAFGMVGAIVTTTILRMKRRRACRYGAHGKREKEE